MSHSRNQAIVTQPEKAREAFPLNSLADLALLFLLAIGAFVTTWEGFHTVSPAVLDWSAYNYWFDGDPPLVYRNMTNRWMTHTITKHHPLYMLVTMPPVYALRAVFRIGSETAVGLILSTVASLWIAVLFAFLRMLRLRRFDAAVFSLLAAVSAAAVFWFPIPETFSFGALSMLLALTAVAYSDRVGRQSAWGYTLFSAGTLSITTTNWMAGIAMIASRFPRKQALGLISLSFFLVLAASGLQQLLFPSARLFLSGIDNEFNFVFHPDTGGPRGITSSFLFHSIVMPEFTETFQESVRHTGYLSVQGTSPGSGSVSAIAGVVIWTALLFLASWGFLRQRKTSKACCVLVAIIAGQFALHLVFGIETFLYSLHFAPFLVAFAALSALTPFRRLAVTLALVLTVVAGVNNVQKFMSATQYLQRNYLAEQTKTQNVAAALEFSASPSPEPPR